MNRAFLSTSDEPGQLAPELRSATATRQDQLAAIYRESRGNHHTTQTTRLALALKTLGSVSTYECRRFLDIYYPPARKFDLLQQGYRIETHWQFIESDCGQIHRVGLYILR
ncbi:helix-turn-helix domain-containing protein [Ralstonia pseudosolanacearum]